MGVRIHQLVNVSALENPPGSFRAAEEPDIELLGGWRVAFHAEAVPDHPENEANLREAIRGRVAQGGLYVWDDGGPVSMAQMKCPTRHGMSIGGVYTPPEHRRHGYAASCVAALSRHILDSGKRFCCLFADRSNPTSNSIYAKVGYRPVCDAKEYLFD